MRSFLIAVALIGICGCASRPYTNLRRPIYMVADQSFWFGCDEEPRGYDACRAFRVKQIYDGVEQWFGYLDSTVRPFVAVVYSEEQVPPSTEKSVIYLRIELGFCGDRSAACYAWSTDSASSGPEIVFESAREITANLAAHEFGHALGRDDNDVPNGVHSIMSYTLISPVTPLDFEMVCSKHPECQDMKRKRKKN